MDNLAHENSKNNKPTNGKGAWRLSDKERDERRSTADELSQHNARDRDRLKSTLARAAEVKELIKATDLGKELEELKDEAKFLEGSIDSRGETIERCLREAQTGETDRQQESLPGVPPAADKAPKTPKPSAAERTVPLLPEWSGPAAGEAQVHEGGELAPEPPRELPALPPRIEAIEAIEAEIVDEQAEARARELWRGLVLDALGDEGPLPFAPLWAEVDGGCGDKGIAIPTSAEMKALLGVMVASGAVVVDDQERYALPTPPKGKKTTKKPAAKVAAKKPSKTPAKGKKPGRGAKAEAPKPPPPPMTREETDFKDLGPTRKPLTNWLHGRLLWAGEAGISWDRLTDEIEASPYFCDELGAAADLLVAVGLARKVGRPAERKDFRGKTRTVFTYFGQVDEHGRTVDETLLDEIAGTLADGPQRLEELAPSLSVPQWALLNVLEELCETKRARRLDDGSWALGAAPLEAVCDEIGPSLPNPQESTDQAVREALAKGPARTVTEVASCLGWDAVGSDPEAQLTYHMVYESLSRVAVRDSSGWHLPPQAEAVAVARLEAAILATPAPGATAPATVAPRRSTGGGSR